MKNKLKILFYSENTYGIINILKSTVIGSNQKSLLTQYIKKNGFCISYEEYLFIRLMDITIFDSYELNFIKYSSKKTFIFSLESLQDSFIRNKDFYNFSFTNFNDFYNQLRISDIKEIILNFLLNRGEYKNIGVKLNKFTYYYINTLFMVYYSDSYNEKGNIIDLKIVPDSKFKEKILCSTHQIVNVKKEFLFFKLLPYINKFKVNKIFYFSKNLSLALEKKYKGIIHNFGCELYYKSFYDYLEIDYSGNMIFLLNKDDFHIIKNKISLPEVIIFFIE